MPHGSGLAQGAGVNLDRPELGKDAAGSLEPPLEGHENAQRPAGPLGPRVAFVQPLLSECTRDPEEEEDEDRDSIAEPLVVDKTLSRLFSFIFFFFFFFFLSKSNPRLKGNRKGIIVKDKEFYIPILNTFPYKITRTQGVTLYKRGMKNEKLKITTELSQ